MLAPVIAGFVNGPSGTAYGVTIADKLHLLARSLKCSQNKGSGLIWGEHVALAQAILDIPPSVPGVVGEFGCFKGLSTCTLSLACKMTGRKLVVFDSFEGLPEVDMVHHFDGGAVDYAKGQFTGTLEEVRSNVSNYGAVEQCEFVKGFFCDTLPGRPKDERFAMIFEDADLTSSVKDVLRHTWSKLEPGGRFYSHEAKDFEVVELFFDKAWWRDELGEEAPGLIAAGIGLPLSRVGSGLAYAHRKKS
jgi:hypothetical protein